MFSLVRATAKSPNAASRRDASPGGPRHQRKQRRRLPCGEFICCEHVVRAPPPAGPAGRVGTRTTLGRCGGTRGGGRHASTRDGRKRKPSSSRYGLSNCGRATPRPASGGGTGPVPRPRRAAHKLRCHGGGATLEIAEKNVNAYKVPLKACFRAGG